MNAAPSNSVVLDRLVPSPEATDILSETTARRLNIVPLALRHLANRKQLLVAGAPDSAETQFKRLARLLPLDVDAVCLGTDAGQIPEALEKVYRGSLDDTQLIEKCRSGAGIEWLEREQADYAIQLLDCIVRAACRSRASDIHLSPEQNDLLVRFRIDGVLNRHIRLHKRALSGLLVRIKILAALDIAESRHPQDGQFSQLIDARSVDFRVSTFLTQQGENTVLRILDEDNSRTSLYQLDLPRSIHHKIRREVHRPDGLLLVCGPTGSGKSTTLYALLGERDSEQLNIMTLEDPVERSVAGLRQCNIDASRGLDYAQGVRALLRQDPDVLLIGEIRDADSCAMALRAAMTGHQVLSTVHAQDTFAALDRLKELGASGPLLAANLAALASQRLLRKHCLSCEGGAEQCAACRGTGYHGRQVIMELLPITPEMAALIRAGAARQDLEATAIQQGFTPLEQHARLLLDQGMTTASEIQRVLGCSTGAQSADRAADQISQH